MDSPDDLLLQREYARVRRCSERTIERERASGTGCPYVKIGRSVRYMRRDVLDFIQRHVRLSTSEPAAAQPETADSDRVAAIEPERYPPHAVQRRAACDDRNTSAGGRP